MVGEGLAGPLAGDQDAAPGVTQVVGPVRFALAGAGDEALARILRVDPVAEPVRACGRTWLEPQRLDEAADVLTLSVGLGLMAGADVLNEVFGQVPNAPRGVLGPGEHAL